jgi:hypothetical protein
LAYVEHHTWLHRCSQANHLSRIAQHQAPFRYAIAGSRHEIGTVSNEKSLQRGQQVVRSVKPNPIDLLRRTLIVSLGPALARGHYPAYRFVTMGEAPGTGIRRQRHTGGREACGTNDRRTLDDAGRPDGRLVALAEPGGVGSQDSLGIVARGGLPALSHPPDARSELRYRTHTDERSPCRAG